MPMIFIQYKALHGRDIVEIILPQYVEGYSWQEPRLNFHGALDRPSLITDLSGDAEPFSFGITT